MSQSATLITAADALTDRTYQCTVDGAWALHKLQLGNALDLLTSELFFCRQHGALIDGYDHSQVAEAVDKCGVAGAALVDARSDEAELQAISTVFAAIRSISHLLPPEAKDLL